MDSQTILSFPIEETSASLMSLAVSCRRRSERQRLDLDLH